MLLFFMCLYLVSISPKSIYQDRAVALLAQVSGVPLKPLNERVNEDLRNLEKIIQKILSKNQSSVENIRRSVQEIKKIISIYESQPYLLIKSNEVSLLKISNQVKEFCKKMNQVVPRSLVKIVVFLEDLEEEDFQTNLENLKKNLDRLLSKVGRPEERVKVSLGRMNLFVENYRESLALSEDRELAVLGVISQLKKFCMTTKIEVPEKLKDMRMSLKLGLKKEFQYNIEQLKIKLTEVLSKKVSLEKKVSWFQKAINNLMDSYSRSHLLGEESQGILIQIEKVEKLCLENGEKLPEQINKVRLKILAFKEEIEKLRAKELKQVEQPTLDSVRSSRQNDYENVQIKKNPLKKEQKAEKLEPQLDILSDKKQDQKHADGYEYMDMDVGQWKFVKKQAKKYTDGYEYMDGGKWVFVKTQNEREVNLLTRSDQILVESFKVSEEEEVRIVISDLWKYTSKVYKNKSELTDALEYVVSVIQRVKIEKGNRLLLTQIVKIKEIRDQLKRNFEQKNSEVPDDLMQLILMIENLEKQIVVADAKESAFTEQNNSLSVLRPAPHYLDHSDQVNQSI